MTSSPDYFWTRMAAADRLRLFRFFTPEQALAAMAQQSREYGIPDKITDPVIVERVARLIAAA